MYLDLCVYMVIVGFDRGNLGERERERKGGGGGRRESTQNIKTIDSETYRNCRYQSMMQ